MALLVPEARQATRTGQVGALTKHYGSPGRLADHRRQFEKTRKEGEDPSIFAIALETLAVKAFGDMGHTTRRFVAGHDSCALRRLPNRYPNRVGKSVTAITGGSAGTEAHSTTQDQDYRHGDFVAAFASGCAGCGFAGATGPRS